MTELEAFVILSSMGGLGSAKIRKLVNHFGSAEHVLKATKEELAQLKGFENVLSSWDQWQTNSFWRQNLDQDFELISKHQVEVIPFTSPKFPKALLQTPDHPAILYVQGKLLPQDQKSIAIVGTRNASIYGMETAKSISTILAAQGFTVISGLARGIDTAAHLGALTSGRTIAVIGSGLAKIYPSENQKLAAEIANKGALISEFSMHTPPDRHNFPQRNRIVSGLSMGVLLIEAPIKSGAMITMQKALSHKRKLFALPGRVDNENFKGNHLLLKNGQAHLVENAEDILEHYQGLFLPPLKQVANPKSLLLDQEEASLLEKMPQAEIGLDELSIKTCLPIQQVQRILMSLILKKIIKEFPGKIYKKFQDL